MRPDLARALLPKTTLSWLVAHHVRNAIVGGAMMTNLWLTAYADTLRLYWGGADARRK